MKPLHPSSESFKPSPGKSPEATPETPTTTGDLLGRHRGPDTRQLHKSMQSLVDPIPWDEEAGVWSLGLRAKDKEP